VVGLIPSAEEFSGPRRWRWRLTEEDTGRPLADHEVDLDPIDTAIAGQVLAHLAPPAAGTQP
jgi:hypothetical protein